MWHLNIWFLLQQLEHCSVEMPTAGQCFHSHEKDVHLMGQHCPVCPFRLKESNSKLHQQHNMPVRHASFTENVGFRLSAYSLRICYWLMH